MHILLIPSWYATAENPVHGSFFREQAHALARSGHRVGVIAPNLRSVRELPAGIAGASRGVVVADDDGVVTYRLEGAQLLPGLKPANDRAWVSAGRKLFARYVAEQGLPDVLHAHATFMAGIIGAELKRESGIPLVVTEHSTVFERRPIPLFQVDEARAALSESDARLVVSPQLGASMERVIGRAACPWEWVPNMVDPVFLNADLPPRRARGPFRFLNVGFLPREEGPGGPLGGVRTALQRRSHGRVGVSEATVPSESGCTRPAAPSASPTRSPGSARSVGTRFATRCSRRMRLCSPAGSRRLESS